ncbi:6-phosphogluconolactonase [Pseudomonas sp. PIC25]|uniref:6-phosphogluconolactonase n=1 Tax=Pseudomonas sp. PIC25 TaxID=1958773 RepID=UPI000BAB38EB|nr:6-phosphogluconolactonase [Pseudomonas sp. PIC25]PAU54920.1 6-phosphogluconolactonase [Pseudomonas sp. PIC25]
MAIYKVDLPAGVVAHSLADATQHASAMAQAVAEALRAAIDSHGRATLVVSGGRSTAAFFEALSGQQLDWSRVLISLADERWVPVEHPESNEGLVRRHLLRGAAASARFLGLYRAAPTLEEAAAQTDHVLAELALPIDVLVLGMGDDGHCASLFPRSPNLADALHPECERRCLPMQAPSVPRQRLTMTYPLLASARLPLLAIQGEAKLNTLRAAVAGDDALGMPIRAFLRPPLEIYWCP